jgi:hypothetical protein
MGKCQLQEIEKDPSTAVQTEKCLAKEAGRKQALTSMTPLQEKSEQLAVTTMMKQVQIWSPIGEDKNKSKPTVVRAKKNSKDVPYKSKCRKTQLQDITYTPNITVEKVIHLCG